ncbi:MAG: ATP-binding protein [Candidatus Binataceae bacterium]
MSSMDPNRESFEAFEALIGDREDEHLEFKEARNSFEFEELVKYGAALANEGGGKIVLGVTDTIPRTVVGSGAFADLERTKAGLVERLHLRIQVQEISHPNGRVLIFEVPARPIGMPIQYKGAYWMRAGESLVPMTPDMLKRIFDEGGPDYSAEICEGASLTDLDPAAPRRLRDLWSRKASNRAIQNSSDEQLLADLELMFEARLTYAGLILCGTKAALGRFLPQAEIVFEYRSHESSLQFQQREEYRRGALSFLEELWNVINLRNDIQQYRDGLFVWDILTFNEAVVREAILNAISHRDYRLPGSVFVRQFPKRIEIISPGGFPPGINETNILDRQSPRNRRIAEVLQKCGLVERSGQGVNRMFEECIRESKPKPDFFGTDEHQVSVTLRGEVQDPRFLRFLEQVGRERLSSFTTQDLLVLDLVHYDQPIPAPLHPRMTLLVDDGVIERVGRGRGTRYILSRKFYGFLGKKGVYTRKRGLDRETNKALLLKHIEDNQQEGSQLGDLMQVLPSLTRYQVQTLLRELKAEGRIASAGTRRAGRWFPASSLAEIESGRASKPK